MEIAAARQQDCDAHMADVQAAQARREREAEAERQLRQEDAAKPAEIDAGRARAAELAVAGGDAEWRAVWFRQKREENAAHLHLLARLDRLAEMGFETPEDVLGAWGALAHLSKIAHRPDRVMWSAEHRAFVQSADATGRVVRRLTRQAAGVHAGGAGVGRPVMNALARTCSMT